MKKSLLALIYSLAFFVGGYSQKLPDQNNFYSLTNKGTHEILNTNFHYASSRGRLNGAGELAIPQRWKFIKINTDGFLYFIQKQNTDSTLDIEFNSCSIGGTLILYSTKAADNEKFYMIPTGEPDTFYISSLSSGLVIDWKKKACRKGSIVTKLLVLTQQGFNGSDSQKWILETFALVRVSTNHFYFNEFRFVRTRTEAGEGLVDFHLRILSSCAFVK